ncbi:thermonuclease family protein [Nanoarchaeota archaeon]
MKSKKRQSYILIAVLIILIVINYPFLDKALENYFSNYETGIVERVVDGDTVYINSSSVRLLGINSPERGEQYYTEAKLYLEDLILNKTVKLEFGKEKYDLYNRKLAYLFLDNQNINLELVENGYANYYFPSGRDKYYNQFKNAWEQCIEQNINLCEASQENCIVLKEFDYNNEIVILENICSNIYNIEVWSIKDEGRKNFVFPNIDLEPNQQIELRVGQGNNNKTTLFWEGEDYVWTKTGDTLFLRDKDNKLVLFESY